MLYLLWKYDLSCGNVSKECRLELCKETSVSLLLGNVILFTAEWTKQNAYSLLAKVFALSGTESCLSCIGVSLGFAV